MNAAVAGPVTRGPGWLTLTRVELRKTVDTRAGFWLLLGVAGLCAVTAVLAALVGHSSDHTFAGILNVVVQPAGILAPVVGILLVTGEWSQRTALTTFALVPQRGRVVAAKLAAALVLSLVALALCLVLAAAATVLGGETGPGSWSLPAGLLGQHVVFMATAMVTGVAFGAALLASAPAIVFYFLLPIGWSALTALIGGLDGVARWLDTSRTLAPMTERVMSATEWAHAATSLALWMLLPLAVGLWRVARAEIR